MYKQFFKNLFPMLMIDEPGGGPPPAEPPPAEPPPAEPPPAEPPASAWQDSLPEDVRQWDEVSNSDSPEKFWGQMTNMKSHLGKSLTIPGEDATPAQKAIFYDKVRAKAPELMIRPETGDTAAYDKIYDSLGKPESIEGYEFELPEAPEGIKLDTTAIDTFKPIAHKIGLNTDQFKQTVEAMTAANIAAKQADLAAQAEDLAGLKTEWGSDYDNKVGSILNMAEKMKAPEHVVLGIKNGALDSASQKWLYDMSLAVTGEGRPSSEENEGGGFKQTPSEAKDEIAKIHNDREHPYHNTSAKGHKEAVEKMRKLYMAADPESSRNQAVGTTVGVG